MKTISADILFLGDSEPIENGFLQIDSEGEILKIGSKTDDIRVDEHFDGALCPGFINAHCHLELSFMFEQIPTHTGLIDFIKHVVAIRDQFDQETQQKAIRQGESQMIENGIVAVGDISNDTRSFTVKNESKLRFHTFVEAFDFEPNNTIETIYKAIDVFDQAPKTNGHTASITPHAPYSCTPTLVNFCDRYSVTKTPLLSIHNQEQPEENQYFIDKTGAWNDLFKYWTVNQDWFFPAHKSSLKAMGEYLSDNNQILFVHNTFTAADDVAWAKEKLKTVFFCSCPNANLYIENRLPDYNTLVEAGADICLGTDSLASNWQLSILEEMKTIQSHFPKYDTKTLIKWACWNGAKALMFEDDLGRLKVGTKPGIVHISNLQPNFQLNSTSKATRII